MEKSFSVSKAKSSLEAMGQKELARKFYSKALELNPNDKETLKAVERL